MTVLTLGVGSGISTSGQATLQNIATSTGGKFYRVANSSDLSNVFIQLAAESTGNGILASAPVNTISANQAVEFPIFVENNADSATFALSLANSSDNISLSLTTPSGNIINKESASSYPNVEFIGGSNSVIFRIAKPESGTWKMNVSSSNVTTGKFGIVAFADHDGVQLNLSVQKDVVKFPEVVKLQATPTFDGQAVVGAKVQGKAIRPDGSSVPIVFYDDGLAEHGDALPGDGQYGAIFNAYNDDGTYTFNAAVENVNGRTFAGEELFSNSAPSNEKPVPKFNREASTTAVVTDVPDFVVATTEFGPETINLKSQGRFVTAYIELPPPFAPANINVSSVKITAIDGVSISPIKAESSPTEVGDFDNDGVPDLMVKFNRSALQAVLSPGMRKITVEGSIDNRLFVGERSVGVIQPGKTK
ncbi:choice-of-anchor X domain-containing protein [Pelatocladus sp. BLCC-F211]|uniref:choice-of-anchor X domain-containing protein n=1 Tax=Pelatocladus sp. BLCC-F211 TaxID=3342752 RepID=UPI0035BA378D